MDYESKEKKTGWKAELISWVQVLAAAVVIAFVVNTFIISNSDVPSNSMENTIMTGSRVIGSRLTYRFTDPKHGDIAIFLFGRMCKVCQEHIEGETQKTCPVCGSDVKKDSAPLYYVKRVIGIPGDTVDIADGRVYLNNSDTPLEEPYLAEAMNKQETFHFEVPEDCYFMMGDNRNASKDARYWQNHFICKDKMTAKVLFEYFPAIKALK